MKIRWSFHLSPLARKRWRSFRRIRRARWSLNMLVLLFLISLMAELLCNSRPLYLRLNGRHFFPVSQNLTAMDLLGPEHEARRVNYKALTASDEFRSNPGNRVVWTPFTFSHNDVVDAAELNAYRTVNITVVPEYHVARLNLLPNMRIAMPVNCGWFLPGLKSASGARLDQHWAVTPELAAQLAARMAGKADPARSHQIRHLRHPELQAIATLPPVPERTSPPPPVRITLRQDTTPETPFVLRFRQNSDGLPYPLSPRVWHNIPKDTHAELLKLAEEGFQGVAPRQTIAWRKGSAEVTAVLREIAWPFPPTRGHWMGIDSAGRDVLARVVYGMRTALAFGLLLALWAMLFGLVIGALQGYFGSWVDIAGQRLTEVWSALPFLYVMIFAGATLGRSFLLLLICYGLFNWIGLSYYMRAEFLRLRSRPFVEAAQCQGLSATRIIFHHILPNALTPMITLLPFTLIGAIGSLAALDFLGFGLPPLSPSWGELLQQARQFRWAWWLILFPATALFVVMLLSVLVGEGLRDAFDPRVKTRME